MRDGRHKEHKAEGPRSAAGLSGWALILLSRKSPCKASVFAWCDARVIGYWGRFKPSRKGGMDLNDETGTEARFEAYTADLASVLGHADRVRPFA